jgi:hypothetical protein
MNVENRSTLEEFVSDCHIVIHGGILITRAITERPDLFAVSICIEGCTNSMRIQFS